MPPTSSLPEKHDFPDILLRRVSFLVFRGGNLVNASDMLTAYWHDGKTSMNRDQTENDRREDFTQRWLAAEPSVSAYVFSVISSFHDAEDLVQQIAQETARRFDQYDPERPFLGWALWITKSRVIDFYRRRSRDQLVFSDDLLKRLAEVISSKEAGRHERREALEHCLDGLPERSRKLLDLRYVENFSSRQIAESIDSTTGSIRVSLTRLRDRLADCVRQRLAMEEAT